MNAKFDFFLFDFDDTLVSTFKLHAEAIELAMAEFGDSKEFDYKELCGFDTKQAFTHLGFTDLQSSELANLKRKYFERLSEECPVTWVKGMKEILEMLDRNHLPYAIVTSGSKKRVTLLLNRLQWYARFEFIIAREDARASKPKPDPYIEAFSRIRLPKSKILVVEDSDNGVTSAKKAGFTVWQLIGPTSNQLLTNNAGDSEALMNWILSR